MTGKNNIKIYVTMCNRQNVKMLSLFTFLDVYTLI